MTRIDGYLTRRVAEAGFIALTFVVGLLAFFTLIEELGDVGEGDYTFARALIYTLLSVPRLTTEAFPIAALIAGLMAYGALAARKEILAMRAAGLSRLRIVLPALGVGVILAALLFGLSEWVMPGAERHAQQTKTVALAEARGATAGQSGSWVRDGADYVHVAQVLPGGVLDGVTLWRFGTDGRLDRVIGARRARRVDAGWELEEVRESVIAEERVVARAAARDLWATRLDPKLFETAVLKPEYLTAAGLNRYARYLDENGIDSSRYRLAWWHKLLAPLNVLVMMLVAMPFVFARERTASLGQRLLIGLALGLVFSLGSRAASHVGVVFGLPPLGAELLPALLFMVPALIALVRER